MVDGGRSSRAAALTRLGSSNLTWIVARSSAQGLEQDMGTTPYRVDGVLQSESAAKAFLLDRWAQAGLQ